MTTVVSQLATPDLLDGIASCTFFADLNIFLQELEKRPFGLTQTGNLQLREIEHLERHMKSDLLKHFKDKDGKMMWRVRGEDDVPTLTKIRLISQVAKLSREQAKKLIITTKGKTYNASNDILDKYLTMVRTYLRECNWAYIHLRGGDEETSLAEVLQKNQFHIWDFLLHTAKLGPISFEDFVSFLRQNFPLKWMNYLNENVESMISWGIKTSLLRDLEDFNIIKKNGDGDIPDNELQIQLTPIGVAALSHAMSEY